MNKKSSESTLQSSILVLLLVAVALHAPTARSQEYCDGTLTGKTIRWIVPSSTGGGYDTYSRLIAPFYEKYTGGHVVVHNRSGAGGRIGATELMNAEPDGLTIGILNGPGLMMAALYEPTPAPDPATDFTILGRVAASRHVWAVAADSSFPGLARLLKEGQPRPIVFGTRGPGNLSFVDIVVANHILNIDADIITGFKGSQDGVLGILRGDIDAVAHSYGSLAGAIDSGELEPYLLIADGPISDVASLHDVPWLAGPDGMAVYAARLSGADTERVMAQANALVELTRAGRLIAAPAGLESWLSQCMRDAIHAALTDEGFVKAAADAGRYLDVARGEEAAARLKAVQPDVAAFAHILRNASEIYGK